MWHETEFYEVIPFRVLESSCIRDEYYPAADLNLSEQHRKEIRRGDDTNTISSSR
jgi:hypothetical protein